MEFLAAGQLLSMFAKLSDSRVLLEKRDLACSRWAVIDMLQERLNQPLAWQCMWHHEASSK